MSIPNIIKDPTVFAAIIALLGVVITAVVSLFTPIGTYLLTKFVDQKIFNSISNARRNKIEGIWTGQIQQDYLGSQTTYPGELTLEVKGDIISGNLRVPPPDDANKRIEFAVTGGFLYERFARLEYNSISKGSVYFGSIIVELNPNGTKLNGQWVAFGAYSNNIVSGIIDLNK